MKDDSTVRRVDRYLKEDISLIRFLRHTYIMAVEYIFDWVKQRVIDV